MIIYIPGMWEIHDNASTKEVPTSVSSCPHTACSLQDIIELQNYSTPPSFMLRWRSTSICVGVNLLSHSLTFLWLCKIHSFYIYKISWKFWGNSPVEAVRIHCTILEMLKTDKRKLPIALGQVEGLSELPPEPDPWTSLLQDVREYHSSAGHQWPIDFFFQLLWEIRGCVEKDSEAGK